MERLLNQNLGLSYGYCLYLFAEPNTFEDAGAYIQRKLECDPNVNKVERDISTHFINTTDTNNVNFLIDATTDIIINAYYRHHCCHLIF